MSSARLHLSMMITVLIWLIVLWGVWGQYRGASSYTFTQMLLHLFSPVLMYGWLTILTLRAGYVFFKIRAQSSPIRAHPLKRHIIIIALHLAMIGVLWPPRWVSDLFTPLPVSPVGTNASQPSVGVMTWNVQRLGELASNNRRNVIKSRTQCVTQAVESLERKLGKTLEVLALQEVSNRRLQSLQSLLGLQCQFISYHPTHRRRAAGLGLCVKSSGVWKINYVRKIKLDEAGSWRALFAELSVRDDPQTNLNLINLHFLPHRIAPRELRSVFTSPRAAWRLIREIRDTSFSQQTQASRLLEVIQNYRDPTLLVGDFNAPPGVGAHPLLGVDWFDVWRQVGRGSGSTRLFGGHIPLRVDYIYARRDVLSAQATQVGDDSFHQCSDHLPVSAHIVLSN